MPPRPDYGLSLSANFEFNGALSLFPISGTDGSFMVPPPKLGQDGAAEITNGPGDGLDGSLPPAIARTGRIGSASSSPALTAF